MVPILRRFQFSDLLYICNIFTVYTFYFVEDGLAMRRKRDKTLKMKDRELFVDKSRWPGSPMVLHVSRDQQTASV